MKKNQIIILIGIFVLLALGIAAKSWVRAAKENASPVQSTGMLVPKFDSSKVERILIMRASAAGGASIPPVEMVREKGQWILKSFWNVKADPAKVEKLIQSLDPLQGELRGTGKKLFRDFGIQDTDSISVKFLGSGNASFLDLRVGMKQSGTDSFFIRKGSGEDIYLVDLNLAELLGIYTAWEEAKPLNIYWADLRLFDLDPEKVTKITVYHLQGEEKTMVTGLERKIDPKDPLKSSWKFLRKDVTLAVDPEKVLKFIATMNSVRAQKPVDPAGKNYGLEKPVWQLAVTEQDKKTIFNAGPKDAKAEVFYIKSLFAPSVFSLSAGYFDDLNPDDARFVKDAAPPAETKKTS